MDVKELQGMLQSDMKLWDRALTIFEKEGTVTKTLDLPYGIGITEVTLTGLDDAGKRREAVGSFGEYIRGVIQNKVGEDEITARAEQAAARARDRASEALVEDGTNTSTDDVEPRREEIPEMVNKEAVPTPAIIALTPEDMAGRRDQILNSLQRLEENIAVLRTELKGIEAYLSAI